MQIILVVIVYTELTCFGKATFLTVGSQTTAKRVKAKNVSGIAIHVCLSLLLSDNSEQFCPHL